MSEKIKETIYIQVPPPPPKRETVEFKQGLWTFKRIGKNIYKATITKSPYSITMTGSDVETELHIPFPHRWIRMHFYHTDSSYAANTTATAVYMKRSAGKIHPVLFEEYLIAHSALTNSKLTETFGETYEYEIGTYTLLLNTTTTQLIFPVFYVQRLAT